MDATAVALSKQLRDQENVDLVIALTHARLGNDIRFALATGATDDPDRASSHGVDLVLGGHDHMFYWGRGVDSDGSYEQDREALGSEMDRGCRIVKSGTGEGTRSAVTECN